jgi:putative nucleotidyltransferase with HDIG domain
MDPAIALLAPPALDAPLPWEALQRFDWVRSMAGCPQDPVHHAEGDVWIHTRMVLETLIALPAWRALPEPERAAVYLACLLHDVAKPATTRVEADGRVTARGHSREGERMARRILYELGAPFALRERVCMLVRYHQIPFFLIDREDALRLAAEISAVTRCDLLALVAEADLRGRRCADPGRVLDNIALFVAFCEEHGCLRSPLPFPSEHSRFTFFREPGRAPGVEVFDDTGPEVIVLSGLPGAGKDTLARRRYPELPVVSLDAWRQELGIPHGENQGPVLQASREQARGYLRQGRPFVWNATNLQRAFREPVLGLLSGYRARIRLVYVEVPLPTLLEQNRSRAAAVPERAIRRMMERFEIPDATEAHVFEAAVRGDTGGAGRGTLSWAGCTVS